MGQSPGMVVALKEAAASLSLCQLFPSSCESDQAEGSELAQTAEGQKQRELLFGIYLTVYGYISFSSLL